MNKELTKRVTEETLNVINARGAVTALDLTLAVDSKIFPLELVVTEYLEFLETLVRIGAIVEIQYMLKSQPDRYKVIYFPAGTVCRAWIPEFPTV